MASCAVDSPPGPVPSQASSGAGETPQSVEVAGIKAAFPGRCRVIKDVGMFTHVVTLQPKDMDVTLKFQMTDSYPATAPEISVRSESLTHGKNEELTTLLKQQAQEISGQPMLQKLVKVAESWLREQGIRPGKTVDANAETYLCDGKNKPKKQKRRKKKSEEEEDGEKKKPSMKTALDVVKRILWDGGLDSEDFLVGYIDRFKGLQEKYFSAFSWEHLAAVDYDVLAIPKHRIQYFKYRQQKIWDKPSRMDNVFGSTGSGITVYDVIRDYQEPGQGGAAEAATQEERVVPPYDDGTSHSDDEGDEDEDDSDDDGITVTIGWSAIAAECGVGDFKDLDGDCEDQAYNPYWRDKMRPNYFLALRITDPEIRQGVEQVQDFILDHEAKYAPCCMNQMALHITLVTLGLDTPEQIEHASQVLKRIKPELEQYVPKQTLKLSGVSHFYHRTIYAQVEHNQSLMDLVSHLKLLLNEAGVEIRDFHDFVPHMTIMKLTRPATRFHGLKNIDPWLYSGFKDMHFGCQRFDGIHLCSMGTDRQENGFYQSPAKISFE